MPGTALVTIGENQWSVEVATTTSELINGLSGRASIPAGTGMLFILPARQIVTVTTNQMLFPIDIIFIKDNLVLDIASNILPGNLVEEATPFDGFLEVNAGEAVLVEVGDVVNVELLYTIQQPGFDISSIIAFAVPLALLGFVFGLLPEGSSKKELGSGHHSVRVIGSSEPIPYGYTKWSSLDTEESAISAARNTGYRNIVIRREGDEFSVYVPITELRREAHSIHGEPRRRLVEKYGSWAVGRAEAVCPEDDVACVTREAERLSEVYRSRYGEGGMEYYTIINPGQTVFHIGDVVSKVALERENTRVRALGEREATWHTSQPKVIPVERYTRKKGREIPEEIEYFPDSPEFLAYTISDIGYADKLEKAFRERMLKVRSD